MQAAIGLEDELVDAYAQSLPHRDGTEGFFMARLRRLYGAAADPATIPNQAAEWVRAKTSHPSATNWSHVPIIETSCPA